MKKIIQLVLLVCFMMGLSQCATKYKKNSWGNNSKWGHGFNETRLQQDQYRVQFKANGFTTVQRSIDFALYRSAELTMAAGYPSFVVLDQDSWYDVHQYHSPGYETTETTSTYRKGKSTTATRTRYVPGSVQTVESPQAMLTIQMIQRTIQPGEHGYNAAELKRSLKASYGKKLP